MTAPASAQVPAGEAALLADLAAGLPPGVLNTDPDMLATYSADRAMFAEPGRQVALVRAREVAQVQHTLRTASAYRVRWCRRVPAVGSPALRARSTAASCSTSRDEIGYSRST